MREIDMFFDEKTEVEQEYFLVYPEKNTIVAGYPTPEDGTDGMSSEMIGSAEQMRLVLLKHADTLKLTEEEISMIKMSDNFWFVGPFRVNMRRTQK